MVPEESLRQRLRRALPAAMKERDDRAVTSLRAALAAIDNAGAVAVEESAPAVTGPIAGAARGLGRTEAVRRELSEDEVRDLVAGQAAERDAAADEYEQNGRADRAGDLRREAAILRRYLDA